MHLARRFFIRGGLSLVALMAMPRLLLAGEWPKAAFTATKADDALSELLGTTAMTASDKIFMKAPEIAQNGAVVPITISTTLPDVKSISIVVEKNPRPLAISFDIPAGTLSEIECRIKMGQTSKVIAVVKTDGGIFNTSKEVKVTIGGCGG